MESKRSVHLAAAQTGAEMEEATGADASGLVTSAGYQRIQAVDRAVALLKAVADASTPPTVLELAQACGINRSTAWRVPRPLEYHGLVGPGTSPQRYTTAYGAHSG